MIGSIILILVFLISYFEVFIMTLTQKNTVTGYLNINNDLAYYIAVILIILIYFAILYFLKKKVKIVYFLGTISWSFILTYYLILTDLLKLTIENTGKVIFYITLIFGVLAVYSIRTYAISFVAEFFVDDIMDDQLFFGLEDKISLVRKIKNKLDTGYFYDDYEYQEEYIFDDSYFRESKQEIESDRNPYYDFLKKYYNCCYLLGVSENSSSNEVARKYKQLVKIYHPDMNNNSKANEKFLEVQEAYEFLNESNFAKYNNIPDELKNI